MGVDEADPTEGLVAFTAPIAAAVLDRRVGDEVQARLAGRDRTGTLDAVRFGD